MKKEKEKETEKKKIKLNFHCVLFVMDDLQ